jgi:AcrR family transcriptional regulator
MKKRTYRMKKRAELEEQTRLRITESAVEIHTTLGPSRSSVSAIAEHAGVRRSTVYRHFPDETALFKACTAHWFAANPLPDIRRWAAVEDADARLRIALKDLYRFYARAEPMMVNVLRDEDTMPIVKQMLSGYRGYLIEARETLMKGRKLKQRFLRTVRAAIGHALAFHTWRSLTFEQGLDGALSSELMCRLVAAAGDDSRSTTNRPTTHRKQ